jgi:hypothetical protein
MATWKCVHIGNSRNSFAQRQQLFKTFTRFTSQHGAVPAGFGVFCIHDGNADTVHWYFSPEAGELANHFNAQPCPPPPPVDGLEFILGSPDSMERHFPSKVAGTDP